MAQSITLTASMRSNLSSLKSIQSQMDSTQEKLSTGKKVNSAIDNASSYYQSRALTNRASDLDSLLDSMGQGIQTIQAANEGIEAITSFVEQMKSVAESAAALDPNADGYADSIASYQKQFDSIMDEVNKLVSDASYQGINLLKGGKLTVTFNETRSNKFDIQGEDVVTKMGIGKAADWASVATGDKVTQNKVTDAELTLAGDVKAPAGSQIYTVTKNDDSTVEAVLVGGKYYEAKASGAEVTAKADTTPVVATEEVDVVSYADSIDASITEISKATDYLRSYATTLGNNYSIIETRQNFTESLIDVLETGSDNLVLADMNEESANYLALQTRQQLAINSLSLASQAAQSVLSLF